MACKPRFSSLSPVGSRICGQQQQQQQRHLVANTSVGGEVGSWKKKIGVEKKLLKIIILSFLAGKFLLQHS